MILRILLPAAVLGIILTATAPLSTFAQEASVPCVNGETVDGSNGYCPLTTLPGAYTENESVNPIKVIKNIYGISIAVAALLALAMIIWAGMEYATAEAITGKSDAKEKWQGAIFGLVLLLSSFLILSTINVDLVNVNLELGKPLSGVPVSGSPLQDLLSKVEQNASAASRQYENDRRLLAEAQKKLEAAQKGGDAAEIEAARSTLESAQNREYRAQIDAKQAQATLDATKALQNEKYDEAVQIMTEAIAEQKAVIDQMTDPAAKDSAQGAVVLNTEKARVDIASVNVLNGLQNGRYPAVGGRGSRDFQEARSKFLSEVNGVVQQLSRTNPQIVPEYRAHALEQLRLIDNKWLENLKKCPRGYTVQGGCNQ